MLKHINIKNKYIILIFVLLFLFVSFYLLKKLNILDFSINNYDINNSPILETYERFHPKIGLNGAVATQEANATKVGIDILKQGGNAVDAAVAVGYALAVTLPRAGNLGGGGFMTIWLNKEQQAYVINYRETAPGSISIKDIKKINKLNNKYFATSYKSVGVPGTVAGLNLAAEKFGSINIDKLIMPAINLAKNGFAINATQLFSLTQNKDYLLKDPEAKKIFYNNTNYIPKLGNILKQPELAYTLELIAKNNNQGFYQGETADKLMKASENNSGFLSKQDLLNYKAELVKPIITNYKNYKIIMPPPPSSGGVIISEILNIYNHLTNNNKDINSDNLSNNSAKYMHMLTEIFNHTYIDRNYNMGDPKFVNNDLDKLLSKQYAEAIAKKIHLNKHVKSKKIDTHQKEWQEGKNTTHFVVIDKDLNIVSNTYTLNYSFGNGKIVPGTGFFLNNELDDFTLEPGKPNAYGLIQGNKNIIAANKQPLSSMTPTIVLDQNNKPYMATGSPGGSRIITTITQILLNTIEYKNNIATAVAAPRIHSQLWPDILYYEDGISADSLQILEKMGHNTKNTRSMGSAQTISYEEPYFMATVDPRRAGAFSSVY